QGRCVHLQGTDERLRPTASFLSLLAAIAGQLAEGDVIAFADQDDVWLPDKLARGVDALRGAANEVPAIYCARQVLVDETLRRFGISDRLFRPAGFPAALTQNVTTGCTVLLNQRAVSLIAGSKPPATSLHDSWCYLVVPAAGGSLLSDNEPPVLYRQHPANVVGAPRSRRRRALAAVKRGPSVFMNVLRHHVAALRDQPQLMSETARRQV